MVMVRRWCLYLAMVLGCLVLLLCYQQWLAWMLLLAVLGTPLFSLAVSLPAMLTVKVKVDCAGVVEAFTTVGVELRDSCKLPMPLFTGTVRVERTPTGESWRINRGDMLPTEHCGQLLCRPEKCYVYDYLMLFRIKVRHQQAVSLVVLPKPVQTAVPAKMERLMSQSWKPKPGGGFAENHEMRQYRPGDSMNQVHWKLTAKTGKLMVREAMEPAHRRLLLTLELRGTGLELDIKMGKLLWLGRYLLDRGLPVDIRALTGDGIASYGVQDHQQLEKAVEHLLCQRAAPKGEIYSVSDRWSFHIGGGTDEA